MSSFETNPDPYGDRLPAIAVGAMLSFAAIGALSAAISPSPATGGIGAAPFGAMVGCGCGSLFGMPIALLAYRKHIGHASALILVPTVVATVLVSLNGRGMPLSAAAACGGTSLLLALIARLSLRDVRIPARSDCAACGYDLQGTVAEICPECGHPRLNQ